VIRPGAITVVALALCAGLIPHIVQAKAPLAPETREQLSVPVGYVDAFLPEADTNWELQCTVPGDSESSPHRIFQAYSMEAEAGGLSASWLGIQPDLSVRADLTLTGAKQQVVLTEGSVRPVVMSETTSEENTRLRVIWASWGGTIQCHVLVEGDPEPSRSGGVAYQYSVADFNIGTGAGLLGASAAVGLREVRQNGGYLFALLHSKAGSLSIKGPDGDGDSSWGLDPRIHPSLGPFPWAAVATDAKGDWSYEVEIATSPFHGSSILWIAELPG